MITLLWAALSTAYAGTGPWVVSEGDLNVYAGTEYQRLSKLAMGGGSNDPAAVVDVDQGIETLGLKLIVSYGLRERIDLEAELPWYEVQANRTDGPVCTSLGLGACRTTRGIGIPSARAKALLVDELLGAPVSVAAGGLIRMGQLTAPQRQRLTNLGEGTTDVGPFLSVGRSGALADGYWAAYAEGSWRYRFPNTTLNDDGIPGSETTADAEFVAGTHSWWSIGPTVSMLRRPTGVDFEDADFSDKDRLSSLSILSVRGGAKLILRSNSRTSFSLAALGTLYARSNPADVLTISAGLSFHPKRPGRDAA